MTDATKPVVHISSLGNFAPADIEVTLEFDDHKEVVPMRALSYVEFQRVSMSVPNPTPPIMGVGADKRPLYDYNDTGYQRAFQEANRRRQLLLLLASLRLKVPGATEDERVATLEKLDANRLRLLMNAVGIIANSGVAHFEASAQFPDGGDAASGASL